MTGEKTSGCGISRIILCGSDTEQKKIFLEGLQRAVNLKKIDMEILDRPEEMGQDDFALLFPGYDWKEFEKTEKALSLLKKVHPREALLFSDAEVYGKVYGDPHPLKENELGYVCHTDLKETGKTCLRMAENLCFRLFQEEKVEIKIVRADMRAFLNSQDASKIGKKEQNEKIQQLVLETIRILKNGKPGEAYNLDVLEREDGLTGGRSPLSPIEILLDTEKGYLKGQEK